MAVFRNFVERNVVVEIVGDVILGPFYSDQVIPFVVVVYIEVGLIVGDFSQHGFHKLGNERIYKEFVTGDSRIALCSELLPDLVV